MLSSPKLASAALALCMVLLSFGSSALVEPKAEVAAATLGWGQALGEGDPEKVLPLYSDDAVLWGTLSPTVRSDRPRYETISWPPSRFCPASRSPSAIN
jgi:hypothetical protein